MTFIVKAWSKVYCFNLCLILLDVYQSYPHSVQVQSWLKKLISRKMKDEGGSDDDEDNGDVK